jgi:hypothetical protein
MRLKRWESPRREGRNDKGRGGSARQRQLKKQQQMLRKKLKEGDRLDKEKPNNNKNKKRGEERLIFPLFLCEKKQQLPADNKNNIQIERLVVFGKKVY